MEAPLWTDRHAPDLADLPQASVREHLERALAEPMNLVVHGPTGVGKTAAVRALARELHAEPESDLIEINVADFFDRTKSEIRDDPRFTRFLQGQTEFSKQYRRSGEKANRYKRQWSKTAMLGHVLKEMAGYEAASGEFKTVLLDNAEAAREDFQQALRRIIEQHHETTQFVIATRQPAALIPAIRSRGFPVPVRAPTQDEIVAVLRGILESEGIAYDDEGLEFVAGAAGGDLRAAIMSAQTTAVEADEVTMNAAYETLQRVEADERVVEMLTAAEAGEFTDARSALDELLVEEGYSGAEVLSDVLDVARSRYTGERLAAVHELAGEIEVAMAEGTSDRTHLSRLLAELGADGIEAV
jgi:replication factor C small subunit